MSLVSLVVYAVDPIQSRREGNQPYRVVILAGVKGETVIEPGGLQLTEELGEGFRGSGETGKVVVSRREIELDGLGQRAQSLLCFG